MLTLLNNKIFRGPWSLFSWLPFTIENSPLNCLASLSFTISTSTSFNTFQQFGHFNIHPEVHGIHYDQLRTGASIVLSPVSGLPGPHYPALKIQHPGKKAGMLGLKSSNTFRSVTSVSRLFISMWYFPLQKKDFLSGTLFLRLPAVYAATFQYHSFQLLQNRIPTIDTCCTGFNESSWLHKQHR